MGSQPIRISRITLLVVPLIFLIIFYFFPVVEIVDVTLASLDTDWVEKIRWGTITDALAFTLFQAIISTLLTLVIGLPAAYLFGTYRFPGKNFLKIITTLPFILPTVVVAAGFNAMIGPRGWLNLLLMRILDLSKPVINLQNTLAAILIAHVFYNTSIVIRVVGSALTQMDPRLEQAAQVLGASRWKAFLKVTFPLLVPPIISALLLVFLFDFTSFGVILMLGGPRFSTLEVEIYIQTMQFLNLPLAGLLSLIQLVISMVVTYLLMRLGGGLVAPVMPHVKNEGLKKPEMPGEKIFSSGMVVLLIILLVLPILGLIARSLLSADVSRSGIVESWRFSFDFYQALFVNTRQSIFYVPPVEALKNSLFFALTSSFLSLILGFMLSFAIRDLGKNKRFFEMLILLPLGTSAVTLGLGFFIAFSRGDFLLDYYPLLIPAAHTLIALPFVLHVIQPAVESIPKNIKDAARTLGASPFNIWRQVELPLIWRAVITSLIYAFTVSLGEFGATSFLARPELPTLPVAIFRYLNLPGGNNYGKAMAMAVVILVVCAAGIFILECFQIKKISVVRKKTNA